jgi:hypothetical protein
MVARERKSNAASIRVQNRADLHVNAVLRAGTRARRLSLLCLLNTFLYLSASYPAGWGHAGVNGGIAITVALVTNPAWFLR